MVGKPNGLKDFGRLLSQNYSQNIKNQHALSKNERISNVKLRKLFNIEKSLLEIYRFRLLKFIGRTIR